MSHHEEKPSNASKLMWWTTLVVAVMAVPGFGAVVAFISPTSGVLQLAVFVLACWLCTYLGMKLMSDPRMDKKIGK
jgi:hypothetical protein